MGISNNNISDGSPRSTITETILFEKKFSTRNATIDKKLKQHYRERELISYIVIIFGLSGIPIGIYNGIIFTRLGDFVLMAIISIVPTLFAAGIIYPYWWGYVKITNNHIIFRKKPFLKFNIFSKLDFRFSAKLNVNFNTKYNKLTFWQEDIDEPGLLALDGLSMSDLKNFRNVICNIKNIDLTLENE